MSDCETKIYRKITASKRIRIASQMYLLGKKLADLNDRKLYVGETQKHNRRSGRFAM